MAAISQPSRSPSLHHNPLSHSSNSSSAIFTRSVLQQQPAAPRVVPSPTSASPASNSFAPSPDGPVASLNNYRQHHLSSSTSSAQKPPRAGGIFGSLVAAIDKTQNAIAIISEPKVRPRQSLGRLSIGTEPLVNQADHLQQSPQQRSPQRQHQQQSPQSLNNSQNRSLSDQSSSSSTLVSPSPADQKQTGLAAAAKDFPSSLPRADSDPVKPPPAARPARTENKMHQTSSRLLRMTDDDRPFTRVSFRWETGRVCLYTPSHASWRGRTSPSVVPVPGCSRPRGIPALFVMAALTRVIGL